MRLLYVIDSLAPGGAETSLVEMAPHLVARGVDLHVLPLGNRFDLAERLTGAGAVVHARDTATGRLGNVRSVVELARSIRPQLVHTTLDEADIAGRAAAQWCRIPSSTSLVSESYGPAHYAEAPVLRLRAAQVLDSVTARSSSRFHAVSRAVATSVGPRLRISPSDIDVIPRGRNPQEFPFRQIGLRRRTRGALGIGDSTPLILAVGRLEPAKGLVHLFNALPFVAARHPDAVILIAGGDGRSGEELHRLAQDLPLDVRFLGYREDVAALLTAADVLCFPSEREGSPGAMLEAMAVGCPVVASEIPPVIEVIGAPNDIAAIVSPVGDHDSMARALNAVLDRPEAWEAGRLEGRRRFEHVYSIESVSQRMVGFFDRAAGNGDTPMGSAT